MVGLSVVLDAQRSINRAPQIISNIPKIKCLPSLSSSSSSSSSSPLPDVRFLDACFLCNQKLLPGKDIYMYKGDRAFCSVECRCRQIVMDEEEDAAGSSGALNPSSSSSASASPHRKGTQKTDRMGSTNDPKRGNE